jgi:hypothetical protein
LEEEHFASEKIANKAASIEERRIANRQRACDQLEKLKDSLTMQQFNQDGDDVSIDL